jgi:two-component system, chemotaxis family, chemotaxis protein CheY
VAAGKLLVVDDHPVNRKLATVLLRGTGWDCDEADSGEEALAKLSHGHYDCVLLDISMPGMSGDEVCRHIRADGGLKDLRVIAYTAHTMREEQQNILAAGFDALLIKPINKAALLESLLVPKPS